MIIAAEWGTLAVGGQRIPFGLVDVLFAAAQAEHRFVGFSNGFATSVFHGPSGGERA